MREELCVYGGLVLRGDGIVVQRVLQKRVLQLAHVGHQLKAERLCGECHGCQVVGDNVAPEPMANWGQSID